ncbi:MAG: (2Fe-2S)-binding protein [Gammaproteobacteria bacterium]
MIICSCQNINSNTLEEMLFQGYSIEEIIKETCITQECGSCIGTLEEYKHFFESKNKRIFARAIA